ncbi:zinc finger BED domain-containing RICESLEEPER 4-like [Brachionus plicatilis]|uniref:Zinc finger BED domain-containing RICESLEEPER 4-like n=2 Tax=Brachionus plicatilis TaxID=10195 RepID=A0A3M7PI58_BRAPC|nr:zinc finger BED domain-containing RICESLEEPER 4-like [Brachionus plicatilis]
MRKGSQPAMELFKNAKVFDPQQIAHLSKNLQEYNFQDSIQLELKDESKICSELSMQSINDFDVEKWWLKHKIRLTKMFNVARWYIKIPASSCDSERAFSNDKIVLDEKRQNMIEETIKMNNFFYFNYTEDSGNLTENEDETRLDDDIIPLENDLDLEN